MDIDKLQSSSIAKSLSDPLTPPQQPPPDGPASDDLQQETGTVTEHTPGALPVSDGADDPSADEGPLSQPALDPVENVRKRPALESSADRPLRLSRGTGGVSNTRLDPWVTTFGKLCEDFSKRPPVGEKDGDYIVRGPFREGSPTRADANIAYGSLIFLDGDSTLDPDTGEITEGAPPPDAVHKALVELNTTHMIYTTHSHGLVGKGNRYRIVIPAVTEDKGDLSGILEWIFHQLVEQGCYLVNVKENRSWSQPWYFPRLASPESDYLCLHYDDKDLLELVDQTILDSLGVETRIVRFEHQIFIEGNVARAALESAKSSYLL